MVWGSALWRRPAPPRVLVWPVARLRRVFPSACWRGWGVRLPAARGHNHLNCCGCPGDDSGPKGFVLDDRNSFFIGILSIFAYAFYFGGGSEFLMLLPLAVCGITKVLWADEWVEGVSSITAVGELGLPVRHCRRAATCHEV